MGWCLQICVVGGGCGAWALDAGVSVALTPRAGGASLGVAGGLCCEKSPFRVLAQDAGVPVALIVDGRGAGPRSGARSSSSA